MSEQFVFKTDDNYYVHSFDGNGFVSYVALEKNAAKFAKDLQEWKRFLERMSGKNLKCFQFGAQENEAS